MSERTGLPATGKVVRVILTGFMGAGKTTVGRALAERLRWTFVDADDRVEARAGMRIAEIFERQGEARFREMEAAAIGEAGRSERLVLALGGGAVEAADTRAFLASLPDTLIVFLDAPLETLLGRCAAQADGPVRPVLRDKERLKERWSARLPFYRGAHLTVDTSGETAEAVAERILEELKEDGGPRAGAGSSGRAGAQRGATA